MEIHAKSRGDTMRLVLATGLEELEKETVRLIEADQELAGTIVAHCYHNTPLIDVVKRNNADTVVFSTLLNGDHDIVRQVRVLRGSKVRVVVMPGDLHLADTREIVVNLFPYGVYDYVYDPVTPEKLIQRLKNPAGIDEVPRDFIDEAMARQTLGEEIPEAREPRRKSGLVNRIGGIIKRQGEKGLIPKKPRTIPENPEEPAAKKPIEPALVKEPVIQEHDSLLRDVTLALPDGFVALGRVDGVKRVVNTVKEAVAARPRAVLVSGTRWIKDLRREKDLSVVPIVVVGDDHDPSVCMAAGADECVPVLDRQAIDLILARAARMRETWAQAETDGLTGCYTRKFLDSYLAEERRPFAVLICDLDHFKAVNDTYGHIAGDEVLKQFGEFLRTNVRETDIVARYGGEEFVVLFTLAEDDLARSQSLCRKWAQRRIKLPGGHAINSTFSAGLASGGGDLAALIGAADKALYRAKRAGRNRVVMAGQESGALELDRVVPLIGEFTVLARLAGDGRQFKVTDARGPFAAQLMGQEMNLFAEDGVRVYSGAHWLFGLSGETILVKRGDAAILVGRGKFNKSDLRKLEGVL